MFEKVLTQATGLVDSRFLLVGLFPTLVAALALSLVIVDASGDPLPWIEEWEKQTGTVQVLIAVGVVAGLFVAANFLLANITGAIRIFEGYYIPAWGPFGWMRQQLLDFQIARFERSSERHLYFPKHQNDRLPTALGNVLRAAERYSYDAYGAPGVILWPRLYALLPADLRGSSDAARRDLDFSIVITCYGLIVGAVGGVYVAVVGGGRGLFALTVGIGFAVAVIAYRSAVEAAVSYGMVVTAAYDLHRMKIVDMLRLPRPTSRDEERRLWHEVDFQVRHAEPAAWRKFAEPASEPAS